MNKLNPWGSCGTVIVIGCNVRPVNWRCNTNKACCLIDLNAKQAYIRAGYSARSAEQLSSRLMSNDKVKVEIARLMSDRNDRVEVTADFVLQGILDIAKDGEQENNRLKAFDMLGKHAGIYERDNKQLSESRIVLITEMPVEDKPEDVRIVSVGKK